MRRSERGRYPKRFWERERGSCRERSRWRKIFVRDLRRVRNLGRRGSEELKIFDDVGW